MFTLVELEGFVAVAEEGSFRKAAERLSISQPPLSRQVQKLERALGAPVFVRDATGARLTPAGRALLVEARTILGRAARARHVVQSAARGDSGSLALGFTAVAAFTLLPDLLRAVATGLPDVELTLTEAVTRTQLDGIVAGSIDVGLARGVQASDLLETRWAHTESLVLATAEGHPLTRLGRAPLLEEVAREPVVNYSPMLARYLHDLVVRAFIERDLTPRFVQFVTQVTSAIAVVSSGLGVALVPESSRYLALPGVCFSPIADAEPGTVRTVAVWRRDNDNPALARFLGLVG